MAYVVDPPHLGVDGAEAESVANGSQPRPRLQGGGGGGGGEGRGTHSCQLSLIDSETHLFCP